MLKYLLACSSFIFAFVLSEIFLRYFQVHLDTPSFFNDIKQEQEKKFYKRYSSDELGKELPLYSQRNGGNCVELTPSNKMSFHPRYGFNRVQVNKSCAKEHLAAGELSVMFLGGSTMANSFAPNYLTTIDHYFSERLKDKVDLRTINVAESGSRLQNEMVRFLIEGVDLDPDIAIFLDGYNEFTSVRHGGKPEDDFYWTAGIRDRVHRPLIFLANKAIDTSHVLQTLLLRTGLWRSARSKLPNLPDQLIKASAQAYLDNIDKTLKLCDAHEIQCFFFLQPFLMMKKNKGPSDQQLADKLNKRFNMKEIERGYQYILEPQHPKLHSLAEALDGSEKDLYFDSVHISKEANRILGEQMARAIMKDSKRISSP